MVEPCPAGGSSTWYLREQPLDAVQIDGCRAQQPTVEEVGVFPTRVD